MVGVVSDDEPGAGIGPLRLHSCEPPQRMGEHNRGSFAGFTRDYGVRTLVWCEPHATRDAAFTRERQIKKWRRKWKLQLIEEVNPEWTDLVEAGWIV